MRDAARTSRSEVQGVFYFNTGCRKAQHLPAIDLELSEKPREAGLGGEDLKLQDRAATITLVHDGRTGRVHVQNRLPVLMKSDKMGNAFITGSS